jgi:PhnB protein
VCRRCGCSNRFLRQGLRRAGEIPAERTQRRIGHAELDFDGTIVMLSDESPEIGICGPKVLGATPVSMHLHVDDADTVIQRVVAAGATLERPPQDQFYGARSGVIRDPFDHRWMIGHNIAEASPEEMQRRYTELLEGG